MLAMPLPCKILRNGSSSSEVSSISFGTIPRDVHSINPRSTANTVNLVWVNLDYDEVFIIETRFMEAKSTKRLSYNNRSYIMAEGYSITAQNNRISVQATFVEVQ
jgi:hypothetical protein